ncbi:F-box domain-containing protein [[Candida] zeylanoides]
MNLSDLPTDLILHIQSKLTQIDTICLSCTCRRLYDACIPQLYENIYITDKHIPITEAYTYWAKDDAKLRQLQRWTVVKSTLRADSSVKLLERTLMTRLARFTIKNLICDDITFILFKLNSWNRRFGLSAQLKTFFFGNVPLKHLLTGYEDITKFYHACTSDHLTQVQLLSFDDLPKLAGKTRQLKRLNLYLCELSHLAVDPKIFSEHGGCKLVDCLRLVDTVEIDSAHNLSLRFLSSLRKAFKSARGGFLNCTPLFPNCSKIILNHTHGQAHVNNRYNSSNSYDRNLEQVLDQHVFDGLFERSEVRVCDFAIACTHIRQWRDRHDDLATMYELQVDATGDENCACMASFLTELDFPNLRKLALTKQGHSVFMNPFSLYYFRAQIIALLQVKFAHLQHLAIDTNSSIYPFHEFVDDPKHQQLFLSLHTQSTALTNALVQRWQRGQGICHVDFADYYESVHIWEMASKWSQNDRCVSNCDCEGCRQVEQMIAKFLRTNSQIQFYLNPTSFKTFDQYYFELMSAVLRTLRNQTRDFVSCHHQQHDGIEPKIITAAQEPSHVSHGVYDIMAVVKDETTPWAGNDVSLHSFFQHESYKDLVNYNFVRDLSRNFCNTSNKSRKTTNPCEIKCHCDGAEFTRLVNYIRHQLRTTSVGYKTHVTKNSL